MSNERLTRQILNQKATRREFFGLCEEVGKYTLVGAGFAGLFGSGFYIVNKLGERLNIGEKKPSSASSKEETPTPTATVAPQESPTPTPTPTPEIPYRTIEGSPPTYKLTERDISFLNWFNSAHLNWRDWNGYKQRIYIPDWIYQLAKTAEVASNGPCSWNQLVGVGLTETGYFKGSQWDPETLSYANAKGVMQFIPGTFKVHAPYEGADPYDPKDNMSAACNKIIYQGLVNEATQEGWVRNFLGDGPTGQMWNDHLDQANNSWLLFKTLEEYERIFNGMYETTVNE